MHIARLPSYFPMHTILTKVLFVLQQNQQLGGVWNCLAMELLNNIKAMLEQSEGEDDIIVADTMKKLRLVNQHWSLWSTGTIGVLRPRNSPVHTVLDMVAETFPT